MKITVLSICGEADHPLLPAFKEYYKDYGPVIQMGVVDRWRKVNGDTSESGNYFKEKDEQHNAALVRVPLDTDYLFYFDVDEFFPRDSWDNLVSYVKIFRPNVVSLQMNNFWKWDNYVGRGGDGWGYEAYCPRVFRFVPGMRYVNHRPPTLMLPDGHDLLEGQRLHFPFRVNHYSYVYRESVRRKLRYYQEIYPYMNYAEWFDNVWEKWNPANRAELEGTRSVHPSCKGAVTELFTGKHDIEWLP